MSLDPGRLGEIARSYRLSQLVYACAALGVADVLAERPLTASEVARPLGTDPDRMNRLLRAAASEGVLDYDNGRYQLNGFSRQLRSGVTGSMRDFVLGWLVLRPGYVSFAYLDEAIRTGRSGLELAFGEDFHAYLHSHAADAARYQAAMESTVEEFRETVSAYDFSRFSTVVDVGGGQGGFLVAIIEQHPHIRGILFDLPEVVAGAPARLTPYPQREAIEIVGGDMFRDVPAGADAYLLSTVLRCFGDDQCRTVLGLCAERMAPGGHLLAVEMVLPEGIPPSPQGLADLQALTVYGGKDRTKAEWAALLQQAGFAQPAFHPDKDPYAIIDAVRA
jgi:hypothetical protein